MAEDKGVTAAVCEGMTLAHKVNTWLEYDLEIINKLPWSPTLQDHLGICEARAAT